MRVWFASGNTHKKRELAQILSAAAPPGAVWELEIPSGAGLAFAPEETGAAFLDNALIKAEALHRLLTEKDALRTDDAIIADDSGICVDALGGRPGIYSARYCGAGAHGSLQNNLSDTERNALLLQELGDNPRRTARFVCAMVLYYSAARFFAAQETLEGELVKNADAASGSGGFGYDPILYLPQARCTAAQLTADEKNRHSHRGKAARIIARILFDAASPAGLVNAGN